MHVCFTRLTDYPWRTAAQPLTSNVIKWFFLPDFAMRPNPSFIFCESPPPPLFFLFTRISCPVGHRLLSDHSADDQLLLLCSSLQWQVFEEENRAAVRLLAGDNVEISRSLDPCSFNQFIPVDNFLHCRSDTSAFARTHSCVVVSSAMVVSHTCASHKQVSSLDLQASSKTKATVV